MLLKLIKYDFKSTYVKLLTTFAVFTLICIIVPLVISVFQGIGSVIYAAIAISCGITAIFIITFIFLFQRYNVNLYGNEGYLMLTLPSNSKKLIGSKLIVALIWTTIATLFTIGSLLVLFYILNINPKIAKELTIVVGHASIKYSTVLLYIVEYLVGTASFFMEIYFAISVAKLPVWHKFGVLMGFVTYFGITVVKSVPSWFYANGSQMISDSINKSLENSRHITMMDSISSATTWSNGWMGILTSVIVCVALFIGTSLLLEKKTSLK